MGVPFNVLYGRARCGIPEDAVLLSFDDGPNPRSEVTARLLDVLAEQGARAAFCVIGEQVRAAPDLVRRMDREGHRIVNHTDRHRHPLKLSAKAIRSELAGCDLAVAEALGHTLGDRDRLKLVRPPYGVLTPAFRSVLRDEGRHVLPISAYHRDAGAGPDRSEAIGASLLRSALRNRGGLFVLHDGRHVSRPIEADADERIDSPFNRSWVPEVVARFLVEARAGGLRFFDPHAYTAPEEPGRDDG